MPDLSARARVLSGAEKERLVQALVDVLALHPEVIFAYLHGSFIGEAAFRDLDVAVCLSPEAVGPEHMRGYESDLASEIECVIKMPVDVRVLNDAPLSFRYHVIKGRPLVVRDAELLDEFRARTWDDYIDFAPFARRYLREAIGE